MADVANKKGGNIVGKTFAVAFLCLLTLAYFHQKTGHWEPFRVALLFVVGAAFIEATKRITRSRKLDSFNLPGLVVFYFGALIATYIATWQLQPIRVLVAITGIFLLTELSRWTKNLPNPVLAKLMEWVGFVAFGAVFFVVLGRPIDWFLIVLTPTLHMFVGRKSKEGQSSGLVQGQGIAKF